MVSISATREPDSQPPNTFQQTNLRPLHPTLSIQPSVQALVLIHALLENLGRLLLPLPSAACASCLLSDIINNNNINVPNTLSSMAVRRCPHLRRHLLICRRRKRVSSGGSRGCGLRMVDAISMHRTVFTQRRSCSSPLTFSAMK